MPVERKQHCFVLLCGRGRVVSLHSGGYERLTLDEIRARLGEDASKRYGSITIERANAGTAKAMPTYKAKLSCKDYNFEKLLSLAAAASILEDTLAENINRSFETAELCYVISFDRYPDRDYGKPLKYSSVFALERCEPVARPYWRFKDNDSYTDWNYAMNIYVDAVTGEVIMLSLME